MNKILESPDHGETVFARMVGSLERTLVSKSPAAKRHDRLQEWRDILIASETNGTLADLVSKAEMVYLLIKDEK